MQFIVRFGIKSNIVSMFLLIISIIILLVNTTSKYVFDSHSGCNANIVFFVEVDEENFGKFPSPPTNRFNSP